MTQAWPVKCTRLRFAISIMQSVLFDIVAVLPAGIVGINERMGAADSMDGAGVVPGRDVEPAERRVDVWRAAVGFVD